MMKIQIHIISVLTLLLYCKFIAIQYYYCYYYRLPTDAVEASIIQKMLHSRQAEKERITEEKDKEIERIVADNKALQLQLSS